ncbi:MAG: YbhN family protein [Specibacter sp.]
MESRDTTGTELGRPGKRRWLRVAIPAAMLLVAIWWVIVPQYASAVESLESLQRISLPLVLTAVVLELLSLAAYSLLTGSILGAGRPRYFTTLRIDLAGLAVNHAVPGGGATAAAARYRLLLHSGVHPPNALAAAAIEVTVSNLVLAAFFGVGLLISLTTAWSNIYYRTASLGALAALSATGIGVWLLTRHTDETVTVAGKLARRFPVVKAESTEPFLRQMAGQIVQLAKNPQQLAAVLWFAAMNWILDAAALWVVLAAFGHHLGLGPLLTVYGVGNILATLPLTPGGLGLVEGVMVPALLGFGTPAGVALLGVIGWRLLQFWLPLPLGAAAYLSLTLGTFRKGGPRPHQPSRRART